MTSARSASRAAANSWSASSRASARIRSAALLCGSAELLAAGGHLAADPFTHVADHPRGVLARRRDEPLLFDLGLAENLLHVTLGFGTSLVQSRHMLGSQPFRVGLYGTCL